MPQSKCLAWMQTFKRASASFMPTRRRRNRKVRVRNVRDGPPLEAYISAGVAFDDDEYVDREDVQAARDAWERILVVADIESQWGALPL